MAFIVACSTFRSGLTIPANQTFLLGEFNEKNYSAELNNKSNRSLVVTAYHKNTNEITQRVELKPKGKTTIYVNSDETVYFKNEHNVSVTVDVILSRGVEGMRYIEN